MSHLEDNLQIDEVMDEEIKMEEDKEETKALQKPKKILKPRPKLDELRIMNSDHGLKMLYRVTKDLKLTGNTV